MAPRRFVTLTLALLARLDVVIDAGGDIRGIGRAAQNFASVVMMVASRAATSSLLR